MVHQALFKLNLQRSEGICWIDENPFLVITILVICDNMKPATIRIRKHVITNELIYDNSKDYQLLDVNVRKIICNQEKAYYDYQNEFEKVVNKILDNILVASKETWTTWTISIGYEE